MSAPATLPDGLAPLFARAKAAMANAYAPYSRFPVGACLRCDDGGLYAGCNVENAAYPVGQCAEASAIGAMVTAGGLRIVEAVVIGQGEALCTPCGGCRQRLAEFADWTMPIHICGPEGLRRTFTLRDLLPHGFGPHNLDD
ncbi:MAG: cytidine deaminase [Alphaproteobacteria bacterium]